MKVLLLIVIVAAAVGAWWLWPMAEVPNIAPAPEIEAELCAQVITPARNPASGEIREFPTPCDVPEGWEEVENDIPALDLEVI